MQCFPKRFRGNERSCRYSTVWICRGRELVRYGELYASTRPRVRDHRCRRRRPVLDDLEYEDSEAPAIGLACAAVSSDDVQDHIKIAHHPILVLPEGSTRSRRGLLDRHPEGRHRRSRVRSGAGDLRIP